MPPLFDAQSILPSICCDVDPDEVSTIQPHDDEAIEQIEANGRDNEQVHGGDIWGMIAQEGTPSLAWRPASLDHVLGEGAYGFQAITDIGAALQQAAENSDTDALRKWVDELSSYLDGVESISN